MKYKHIPVMLNEVLKYSSPKSGDFFVDCTLGGGGYTEAILEKVGKKGQVLAIDLDEMAIKNAQKKLKKYKNLTLVNDNFGNLSNIIKNSFNEDLRVDGVVMDLGFSSAQIDDEKRGFSFHGNRSLDMHFGKKSPGETVENIVNNYSEEEIEKIIKDYGEERFAKRIAVKIVEERKNKNIKTTKDLSEIIKQAIPKKFQKSIHPATKTFQALRIAANDELGNLKKVLPDAFNLLKPGGRLVVVSFHSLEDRIVKHFFKEKAKNCICSKDELICSCNHKAELKILTKKPILPTEDEIKNNPRSRSAKLRAVEKI